MVQLVEFKLNKWGGTFEKEGLLNWHFKAFETSVAISFMIKEVISGSVIYLLHNFFGYLMKFYNLL